MAAALGVTVGEGEGTGESCQWQDPAAKPHIRADGGGEHPGRRSVRLYHKAVNHATLVEPRPRASAAARSSTRSASPSRQRLVRAKRGDIFFKCARLRLLYDQTKTVEKTLALEIVQKFP